MIVTVDHPKRGMFTARVAGKCPTHTSRWTAHRCSASTTRDHARRLGLTAHDLEDLRAQDVI